MHYCLYGVHTHALLYAYEHSCSACNSLRASKLGRRADQHHEHGTTRSVPGDHVTSHELQARNNVQPAAQPIDPLAWLITSETLRHEPIGVCRHLSSVDQAVGCCCHGGEPVFPVATYPWYAVVVESTP